MNIIIRENERDRKVLLNKELFEKELKEQITEDVNTLDMYNEYLCDDVENPLSLKEYQHERFNMLLSEVDNGYSIEIMGDTYVSGDENIIKEIISLIENNVCKIDDGEAFYSNNYPDFYEAFSSLLNENQIHLSKEFIDTETDNIKIDSDGYPRIAGRVSIKDTEYSLFIVAIHHNIWEYYLE
ncbi:hypothetical protein ACSW8S_16435 (plasmid) [Clostridium perfringens]